jgi:hypothetical protein
MSSLTADILSKSLLELLEMSESNGPGLISIPDIINKMQRTMKKLRHLRTKMLLLVFTCNLCISGQQSDLFTLLVFFLVSAALQKKCTNINNGVILVPYNKSRLKQAISVMLNSLPLFTERLTV